MEGGGYLPISLWFLHSQTGKFIIDGVELIMGVSTIFHVQFSFFFLFLVCRFLQFFLVPWHPGGLKNEADNICFTKNSIPNAVFDK